MEQLLGLARSRDEAGRADVQRGVLRVVHSPQIDENLATTTSPQRSRGGEATEDRWFRGG